MLAYVNPTAAHARVIAHDYFNASDNPGQYDADERDLQAATAAFVAQPDFYVDTFWYFRKPYEDSPGTLILCDGVDPRVDGTSVDIWTYNGHCFENLSPDTVVFVSKKALREQGFEVPENANAAFQHFQRVKRGEIDVLGRPLNA